MEGGVDMTNVTNTSKTGRTEVRRGGLDGKNLILSASAAMLEL